VVSGVGGATLKIAITGTIKQVIRSSQLATHMTRLARKLLLWTCALRATSATPGAVVAKPLSTSMGVLFLVDVEVHLMASDLGTLKVTSGVQPVLATTHMEGVHGAQHWHGTPLVPIPKLVAQSFTHTGTEHIPALSSLLFSTLAIHSITAKKAGKV
jgi:hypothetical protein